MEISRQTVVQNFLWKFAERCGSQLISFLVSIVLARLLLPSDYGLIALCMATLLILQVFADSGLGTALIQKKDPDDLDFSSVFFANLLLAIFLYLCLYAVAPFIADFYSLPELRPVLRVLSLVLLINAFRNVQQAYVSKHMIFKRFFYSTLGASIFSAVVGIGMAYGGFGVWALVGQQLSNSLVGTAILYGIVPWRPHLHFSFLRLKELFSFGWKLLASALIASSYEQFWQLVIGKFYSAADLAFYTQGQKFPQVIVSNINSSIDSVLLPTMSSVQDNRSRVRDMTRRAIQVSIFVMAPLMMTLACSSDHVVELVLTEKWLPCVPFLCIFCFNYMFWPVHTANLNAINALGRSDIFLKLEVIKTAIGVAIVLYAMQYSVFAMAVGTMFSGICSQLVNSWPNKKLLGYGYLSQFRDFCPSIFVAAMAGGVTYLVGRLALPLVAVLFLQILAGLVCYVILAFAFRLSPAMYCWQVVQRRNKANKN